MVNINDLRKHAEERRARLESGGFLPDQPISDDLALAQRIGESDTDYMARLERDHPETVHELQMRFMGYAGQVSDAVLDLFRRTYGTLTLPGGGTFAKLSGGKVGISVADLLGFALQTGALNQMTDAINGASIAALQGGDIRAMAGEAVGAINGVGSAALQAINGGALAQMGAALDEVSGRIGAMGLDAAAAMGQINESITQAATAALAAYSPFNDPEFRRQMEETFRQRRDQDSRGYDYSEHHLAPDHPAVTQLMGVLDYGAFLDAQEPTGPDHERLIADMRAAIATPEGDTLRRGIAHELTRRIWGNASTGWDYRGDNDPEPDIAELLNTETGETVELPVTGAFITDIATSEIDRMAAGLDQYDGGRWGTWRDFRDILTAQSERDVLEGIWAGYLNALNTPPSAPHYRPTHGETGFGLAPSNGVTWGATRAQYSPAEWQADPGDGMPTILNPWGKRDYSKHSFSRELIAADDAWEVVLNLGDRHADALDYIHTKWLANRDEAATGWGIQLDATELLASWGIKRHTQGHYEPKQIDSVAKIIRDLALQTVTASITCYPAKGERGKPETGIIRETSLITIEYTDARLTLTGEHRPFRWRIKPGAWAVDAYTLAPQYKAVHRAILALDAQAQYAKRIGRELEQAWRVRAASDDLERPFFVGELLRGARIELPQTQETRFRKRVEDQLDRLKDIGVIASWSYPDGAVTQSGKKGHAQWLDARIVFAVPDHVRETYSPIAANKRRGRRRRALASQNVTK